MNERIALGFHTCVDFELEWDTQVVAQQIRDFDIQNSELRLDIEADSERAIWILCLAHLKEGIGCEIVPDRSEMCVEFSKHFKYKITLGGTATRAAIILAQLGYPSILQTSSYNEHIKRMMPKDICVLPGTEMNLEEVYPHVVLQCAGGVHIRANDIDFVTPRENRILISRDEDSLNIPVLDVEFGKMIEKCEVFLLGSFTEIIDFDILQDRIAKTKRLLSHLPENAIVVMEDGCYIKPAFRRYVHEQLATQITILSMNEDELQQYIGKKINILNPYEVHDALRYVYENVGVQKIIIHSAAWALAYGENPGNLEEAIEGGVTMAATRFRLGDHFNIEDFHETKTLNNKKDGVIFCDEIKKIIGNKVLCIPCKDMNYVKYPTVVGLGDSFAGGLVMGLMN